MANQIIIDIGAVANDGTGDPLRTAFGYVNDNFSNVWATGVANANIGFSGNKILTVNTNGNLVLAPNGTGKVVANVDIVPNTANVRNLGALTNRWSTVYSQYLNISGDTTLTGDVTVGGNLTVEGDTIQIGNITTDTKTIQLANTANTANAANGSGVTVGANDNIATMLYSSTSNTWVMNIGANITGNVTAPYFIGNGSQLTGITSYSNTNATSLLASFGSNTISTTGNITAGYFIGNGSQLTGVTSYANANVVAYGQAGWAGNIIPTTSNTYSLGNSTNQWSDLYVSNATIYMNNVPVSLTAGNVLTVNGEAVLSNDSNATITTTGNITANNFIATEWVYGNLGVETQQVQFNDPFGFSPDSVNLLLSDGNLVYESTAGTAGGFVPSTNDSETIGRSDRQWSTIYGNSIYANVFYGDGSQLTGLSTSSISNGTSNVTVPSANSNVIINTNGTYAWTFDDTGNLTIPNGGFINFVNTGGITQTLNEDLKFTVSDDEEDGWAVQSTVNDGAGNDLTRMQVRYDGVRINTDIPTNSYYWNFRDTGEFEVPGPIRGPVGGNLVIDCGDASGSDTFIDIQTRSHVGDALISNIRIANPNVTVSTSSGAYNWTFGGTGNLVLPPSGNIVGDTANNNGHLSWFGNSSGDGNGYTTMRLVPDDTLEGNDQYLIIDPTAPGHIHIRAGGTQDNSGAELILGGENSYFRVDNGSNPNVYIRSNSNTWRFGTDGNLVVPNSIYGTNSGAPIVVDAGATGDSLISIPSFTDGGEQLVIKNKYNSSLGIRIETETGNFTFSGGSLTFPDSTTQSTAYTGATYGDSNVTSLLSSLGSNTISGTGNISGGNLLVTNATMTGNLVVNTSISSQGATDLWLLPATNTTRSYGNINPFFANTYNLGGSTTRWNNVFANVANVITLNSVGNITGGNLITGGLISATGAVSGQTLISTQSATNEGGEIQLALPSSGSTLGGNIVIDSYQDQVRFFEGGGNSRGLFIDVPNVSVSGQYAIGYRDVPQIALSGNVTANSITAGKHFYSTTAGNLQVTIPDNANVAFPLGATLTIVMNAAGNVIVAQGTGVSLYMAGSSSTGNRTVGAYGLASVMKVATDTWVISGTGVY